MGQVVFNRFDLDFLRIEAQLLQAPDDLVAIALVATVAHQDRVKGAVRGVPVTLGVVPARLAEQADRGERDRHHVNVGRLDAGLFQAELRRFVGHAVLCMFVAYEALFFGGRDQLAVDIQGCGRIMAKGAGQAKNRQCHRGLASFSLHAGGLRREKVCFPPGQETAKGRDYSLKAGGSC